MCGSDRHAFIEAALGAAGRRPEGGHSEVLFSGLCFFMVSVNDDEEIRDYIVPFSGGGEDATLIQLQIQKSDDGSVIGNFDGPSI